KSNIRAVYRRGPQPAHATRLTSYVLSELVNVIKLAFRLRWGLWRDIMARIAAESCCQEGSHAKITGFESLGFPFSGNVINRAPVCPDDGHRYHQWHSNRSHRTGHRWR